MNVSELSPQQRDLLLQRTRERRLSTPSEGRIARRQDPAAPVPLSFAQQRLWFFDQLFPQSPAYNIPLAVQITGPFPAHLLRTALDELIRRHETLRTSFRLAGDQPFQFVAPHGQAALPVIDLTALAQPARDAASRKLCEAEALRPFDLAEGPLLRSTLLRLTEDHQILMLVFHHIIADLWSLGVFVREMMLIYDFLQRGRTPALPELPIQYPDFALWQRQWLHGERLALEIERWREEFTGAPTALAVPVDRPRPPVFDHAGILLPWFYPAHLTKELRRLGQRQGTTLFMTLLAAYCVLLARYSSQDDLIVGSAVANRTRVELEGLIGFFINLLVVRADLTGRPSFQELLEQIKEKCVRAFNRQDLPFQQLVNTLGLERDLSREPLVQAVFGLQDVALPTLERSDVRFSAFQFEVNIVKYDLSMDLRDDGERLGGVIGSSQALFETATIARIGQHFAALLERLSADPERPVWELPLLSEAERQQLLLEWCRPQAPVAASLTGLLAAVTDRQPSALAAMWEGGELSYGELASRSSRSAIGLRNLGVGPEVLVGLFLERSPELLVGMTGVLAAGGACLLLDPARERSWLERVLDRSGVSILLTQERMLGRLPEHGAREVLLEGLEAQVCRAPEPAAEETAAACLAFVVQTSGASHPPRFVGLEHRGIASWVRHWRQRLSAQDLAWLGGASALETVDGAFDLIVPLCLGGCVVLGRRAPAPSSFSSGTPSELAIQLRGGTFQSGARAVRSFGEPLRAPLAERLRQAGIERIYDSYSSTVGGIWDWRAGWGGVPGVSGADTDPLAYVLDPEGEPVPIGVTGELWLSGNGLARGYAGSAERTAERFVPDRFSGLAGGRLVHTGDLARRRPNGSLELLGETDREVEVHGQRLNLGSIEQLLASHPGVLQAAARLQREDRTTWLVAYAMTTGPQGPTAEQLREHLKALLPEPQVPREVVVVEDLPRTRTGRVDLQSLPRVEMATEYVAPRTEAEKILAAIWRDLLETESIGVNENFFRRGGHSLLAARLISRIEQEFGVEIPLNTLFQTPTIEGMAKRILETSEAPQSSILVNLQPLGERPPLFFIHPVGGAVFCYQELAGHLGTGRPFFGLQADEESLAESLEEMAESYIEAIRDVQREGPYFLGGWSLGAVVAFEMARRLWDVGETVAFLAMVDAPPAEPERRNLGSMDEDRWFIHFASDLLGDRVFGSAVSEQTVLAMTSAARLAWLFGLAQEKGIVPPDLSLSHFSQRFQIFRHNLLALAGYVPRPLPGSLTFLRCAGKPGDDEDLTRGWGRMGLGGVATHMLPGNHYSILRGPHVLVLADKLKAGMESASS